MLESIPADQLERLIGLIQAKIRRTTPSRMPGWEADEDLVQEVLLAVVRRFPQFDPLRASLTTFVARITESVLIDVSRKQTADKRNPLRCPDHRAGTHLVDQWGCDDPALVQRDLIQDLEVALRELPAELERLARELQHWTPEEVAKRDGTHRGTVYRRIARLRDRWADSSLKDYLEP